MTKTLRFYQRTFVTLSWKGKTLWIRTSELLEGNIYSLGENITEDGLKNSGANLFPKETVLIAVYEQRQRRRRIYLL